MIVTDDNPRSEDAATIRSEILAAAPGAREIGDRAEAIRAAVAALSTGDVLVIAGKGHETGQYVKGEVRPFSDREEAVEGGPRRWEGARHDAVDLRRSRSRHLGQGQPRLSP